MSGSRISMAIFRRQLTVRERLLLFITLLAVAGALVYQFPYLNVVKSVSALTQNVTASEKEINDLVIRIADFKAHEAEIKADVKSGITGWNLADRSGAILFLEDVSSEAKRGGVSLVSIRPAQEINKEKYSEVSMFVDLKGRYRELAVYFKHLENLSRIINIRKIRVEACPDSASSCATQLEAVTYMEK